MDDGHAKCLKAIDRHWKRLTFSLPEDNGIHIGLPNQFVSPSLKRWVFENDQFYWDTYFTILGLIESGRVELAKGMVDNLLYLFGRFRIIPSRNRFYNLGGSQIPFLTSMILEVHNCIKDTAWFEKASKVAEDELKLYWKSTKGLEKHQIYYGLSRYIDHHLSHVTAEHEAGWDVTSRFANHCIDYLPIDLNCCLYKYELDLADINDLLGNEYKAKDYRRMAENRKRSINRLMWNDVEGFYYDFNYMHKRQSTFCSLAGFYPMWCGLASKKQARMVASKLAWFECDGGLANTTKKGLSREFRQWDYPNGWPNQQWIVIKGLMNYGHFDDAKRIAIKWLDMNTKVFLRTNKFWEKYDVVRGTIGKGGRYPTQAGFGWTNAIYLKLAKEFLD